MIVARVDERKWSSMSSTLGTVLLMFLVIRLNDRRKNHLKCNCLDIRATTLMNEVLLEWAHSMAEGIQFEGF